MTQTSDNCPNKSEDGSATGCSSIGKSMAVGIADHDKVERREESCETTSISSSAAQEKVAESVEKVSQAEESTETGGQESSKASAGNFTITTSGIDTRPIANNIPSANVTEAVSQKVETSDKTADCCGGGVVSEMNVSDGANTTTSSLAFNKAPECAICSEPCICYCKSCKRASYCSKEHQKMHYKEHRPECYPVTVQVNSVHGSYLVATRDIRRGEVILRESPLVQAPFFTLHHNHQDENGNADYTICLACHKIIQEKEITTTATTSSSDVSHSASKFSCSRCKWPVCCSECEKNPLHADQECKIFAEYHVEPSALCDKDAQFFCVALLRILQHKTSQKDPNTTTSSLAVGREVSGKWSRFMDVVNKQVPMKDGLNSQLAEATKSTARISSLIRKSLGSIISSQFSVTDAEIDQIVQTLRTNSFITDNDGNYINGFAAGFYENNISTSSYLGHGLGMPRSGSSNSTSGKFLTVYHLASMLTSNCVPNVSWVIQQPGLEFYLRASTSIKTGERIHISFVDPLLATHDRRKLLWKEKYLSCSCSRCTDFTEFCTFFSAIKCPGKKVAAEEPTAAAVEPCKNDGVIRECEGYLLPTDPLAVTYTSWHSSSSSTRRCCSSQVTAPAQEMMRSDGEEAAFLHLPGGEKLCEQNMAEWKCNVCLMRQPWGFVVNSLERMRRIFLSEPQPPGENVCFMGSAIQPEGTASCGDPTTATDTQEEGKLPNTTTMPSPYNNNNTLESLEARVDKIDSLVGNVAHANHHYILKMENEILSGISELLEKGQVPFSEMEKWSKRMIELCKKGLKVVNVLCPGLSRERGRLLYYLQQALTINLLFKTSRAMRANNINNNNKELLSHDELMKKFYEIILARKELLEVFAMTKENSREEKMLRAVQHDSIEIRLLKNYFKSHQNLDLLNAPLTFGNV